VQVPVLEYKRQFYTLPYERSSFSLEGITKTGNGLCRRTFSATLPKRTCPIPVLPCVPMTIICGFSWFANLIQGEKRGQR